MDHVAGFRGLRFGAANLVVGGAEEVAQLAEEPVRPHPELRRLEPETEIEVINRTWREQISFPPP